MCGIVGVFTHHANVCEHARELPALVDLMARRGPDDVGQWSDDRHAALGCRRLAVLDLTSAGHQPMVSGDGRHALVFNGEVTNFRELRRELEATGVRFRSRSDSEVVLEALRAWGTAALRRFNGMFALAFYDAVERRILLARDPLGIKPLYYLVHRSGLVFGSQFDQLLRHHFAAGLGVDPAALALYLRFGYLPAPYALYRDTRQLEPGCWLELEAGGTVRSGRYYTFTPSEPLLRGPDASDAVADAIAAAVERNLVSDVPVGAFLSGGVDSPLVAAHMQRCSPDPVPAFTIGSGAAKRDESDASAAYAQRLGLDHTVRRAEGPDAVALVTDVARAYSEPFADYSAIPTMMVSALARERVTVALSGDGADELFWGYPKFRKVQVGHHWFGRPRPVRVMGFLLSHVGGTRLPRRVMARSFGDWYGRQRAALDPADLRRLCAGAAALPEDFDLFDAGPAGSTDDAAQWLRTNELHGHLQRILMKVDRASMYYGLEVRVPFLDLSVLEAAAAVDPSACMRDDVGKAVVRDALGRFVPPDAIPTAKRGFSLPVGDWLRTDLRPLLHERLLERDPFPHGLFDRAALRRYVDGHLAGQNRTNGVWALLALQLWADEHVAPAA